jgi:PLP dependent protein
VTIEQGLASVRARIADACGRADRAPSDVTLIAVAKTFSADRVLQAIEAGATDIGENRAQELKEKAAVIGDKTRWHFIGPLQTNKVRQVVGVASLIHSVDRIGLAEAIARRARSIGVTQQVLLEVNLAGEATKAGVEPPGLAQLATEVGELEGIEVVGLMAIPPLTGSPEEVRPYFRELASLRNDLGLEHLSMGMTGDFEIAVEEGSTLVRVGRAIFGPRSR